MGEFEFIKWVRTQVRASPQVIVGPGDDCAVVDVTGPMLVTTDMLMDGTDFLVNDAGVRQVGCKAMAVNISDIAAMAGIPTHAVVSVALPQSGGAEMGRELFLGMKDVADEFNVAIVGGDTNAWAGPLVVNVTLWGKPGPKGPVLRSGARVGDWLFVTGPLGGSLLGKHLHVKPRVREALALSEAVNLHAMIDISDGLTADLNHILVASAVGAELQAEAIPLNVAAEEWATKTGRTALDHALSDGEDFELLFAVSPEDGAKLQAMKAIAGITPVKIGECVPEGLWLNQNGNREELLPKGWVHRLE